MSETVRASRHLTVKTKLGRFLFVNQLRSIVGPLVLDGACLECGSVEAHVSPPFIPHQPYCPGLRRMAQVHSLVKEYFDA